MQANTYRWLQIQLLVNELKHNTRLKYGHVIEELRRTHVRVKYWNYHTRKWTGGQIHENSVHQLIHWHRWTNLQLQITRMCRAEKCCASAFGNGPKKQAAIPRMSDSVIGSGWRILGLSDWSFCAGYATIKWLHECKVRRPSGEHIKSNSRKREIKKEWVGALSFTIKTFAFVMIKSVQVMY